MEESLAIFLLPRDCITSASPASTTRRPRCPPGVCRWYTAHIATDEGTTYSLSRGKMGSSLRNATGMQLCWPAVPEECVWWVPVSAAHAAESSED